MKYADEYYDWAMDNDGTYNEFLQSRGLSDPGYNPGTSAPQTTSSGGHATWLDFGTALLDSAGNVISVVDKNGNTVPVDQIDELHTTDHNTTTSDNTFYYILIVIVIAIIILIAFMMLKKKKKIAVAA